MFQSTALLALVSAVSASVLPRAINAGDIKCPITLDGRVAASLKPTDFDSYATSPFNPDYVKGEGTKFSDILLFPADAGLSRFDNTTDKAFEVTIADDSIFQTQKGFRRAGLQIQGDENAGSPAVKGVQTIHFSVKLDAAKPLNLSHEYIHVWHEAGDYSANQFNFQSGAILGQTSLPKDTFKVLDRKNKQIWSTPIEKDAWQNFAITLDFNKNTLQVYYSKGDDALKSVTSAVTNDNSGEGQYQIGILKKPTGTSDVVNAGYQESGIHEGLIYGGLFIENSASACISL